MKFLVGDNWKDYFDVVIVQARKPRFFTEESRPLRIYDEMNKTQLWDRVTKLQKGVIYLEVSDFILCNTLKKNLISYENKIFFFRI